MTLHVADLHAHTDAIRPELDAAIAAVLGRGAFARGPFVIEAALAGYVQSMGDGPEVHGVADEIRSFLQT